LLALFAAPGARAQETATGDATDAEMADATPLDRAAALPAETPADIVEGTLAGRPITTLTDALRYAYWTSPVLLAQRSSTQSSAWGVAQARAAYGPKLDYALTYGWTKDRFEIAKGVFLRRSGWTSTATAVLTQPLFTFGRAFANERGTRAQAAYQLAVLRSTEQQALLDAVDAFVGLRRTAPPWPSRPTTWPR
jgi:outer membrane protein TolC